MTLSGDPQAGARRAYLALNPFSTDDHWESWLKKARHRAGDEVGTFLALAVICNQCVLERGDELESSVARHVSYSAGYYEAMASIAGILPNAALTVATS